MFLLKEHLDENKKIESTLNTYIQKEISDGLVENMSVYYINYKTGEWAGVNQNDRFDPASMLKVPIMIAYYKSAEKNPNILSQKMISGPIKRILQTHS